MDLVGTANLSCRRLPWHSRAVDGTPLGRKLAVETSVKHAMPSPRASFHSITSSARLSSVAGTSRLARKDSPNWRLWNIRWPGDHSGFAPENSTTLPHFYPGALEHRRDRRVDLPVAGRCRRGRIAAGLAC